jgi:hypothetical protein
MRLGIINSLDFKAGDYKICSMNAYFFPTSGATGPATHHTCITNYQHRLEMPHYVKHQTPNDFARSLTQKHIGQKLLDGYFVVLSGDLNYSPDTYSLNAFMTANQLTNLLQAAFGHDPLFHKRDANSSKMKNTTIDHAMHTSLPDNIVLQQVGVCNVKTYEDYNDYGDHLPVWANFKMTTLIVFVQPRKPLPLHKRCYISSMTEATRQNQEGENWDEHVIHNKLIMKQIARSPKHTLRNHGRCVAALLRVSVEAVEYGK